MASDLNGFVAQMRKLEQSMVGPGAAPLLHAMGVGAKDDASKAAQADLGDRSMSHWRRGNPIELAARYDLTSDESIDVTPTPRSRGPWRVMEEGRKGGSATDLVQVGRRRTDGTRRGRSRGRNSGSTAGKNTWTEASQLMAAETPKRVQAQHVKDINAALR